jgi:hypothetical protein
MRFLRIKASFPEGIKQNFKTEKSIENGIKSGI